ncbi:MAG: aromatic amino acid transport family protein [Gammaproteobacteria bacterium]|nr:aromatic amino acid transport family protein [Gammaproteobacteria bacterium]
MRFSTFFQANGQLGATLLITGCCIGAGMLGMPVMSAMAGFIPTTLAMALCYCFTTFTGLLILEATLWFNGNVNLPSIVEMTLGKFGKVMTLLLFLFLFYCLFVAYLDGGGALFADIISSLIHHSVSRAIGILACVSFVGIITYLGTQLVDGINRSLLLGLVISYCILVCIGLPKVSQANLKHMDLTASLATIPILLICFGYHNLVPSITYYLKKNVNAIRFAIIVGNLIPFFVYLLWNFVILGMLNSADIHSSLKADMVTDLLQGASSSLSIIVFVKMFSLFAMLTSFIPTAISFADFLKDGFKKTFRAEQKNDFVLYGLVFIPPLICTLFYPHLFLQALGFAGGFIDVLLFGALPATVILVGRNIKKMEGPYQVIGGNLTPIIILLSSALVLLLKLKGS